MSVLNDARSTRSAALPAGTDIRAALEAFWDRAATSKLETRFALAREMDALPGLSIEALRAVLLPYRHFTCAFITDLAVLVARCPDGRLRSLLGQLVDEELGEGDPEQAHARLYDRFLESIGAITGEAQDARPPKVAAVLAQLSERTARRSPFYAIGMRGLGGECVCGVYFSVMHGYLRKHPFIVDHDARIDWKFWDIHAGHADAEHNAMVRASVSEVLQHHGSDRAVAEIAEGYDFGTAMWNAFWAAVYHEHGVPVS